MEINVFKKEIVDDSLEITNTETGELRKIKLATSKQLEYIRDLEKQLNLRPRKYKGLAVWQAKVVIKKLIAKQRPML